MAEIPSSDAPPAIPSFTSELRVAALADDAPAPAPEPALIEAPANLRGAAIAKMQADTVRKPIVDNKPCWDKPTCREVQLGIPSPIEGGAVGETSAAVVSVTNSQSCRSETALASLSYHGPDLQHLDCVVGCD